MTALANRVVQENDDVMEGSKAVRRRDIISISRCSE
jgi:hypothetical protein